MLSICHHKFLLVLFVDVFLLLMVGTFSLRAEVRQIKGKPALPGEECQTNPREIWTQQEKWVWEQVCRGKIADFNKIEDYCGFLNPKEDREWPEKRILSPAFIETILLHEPYLGALPRDGVCIIGAWFKEPFFLKYATLSHTLRLDSSRFESEVNFFKLKTFGFLSIEGSAFKEKVDLSETKILGGLNMNGSKFTGKLDMNGMKAEGDLLMRGRAEFAEVDLCSAKIGGLVAMNGSKFTGKLNMTDMEAEGNLLMHGGAEFAEVELVTAKIGGQVAMHGSKFTGKLDMNGMEAGHLFMYEKAEFAEVELVSAKIGGQVVMSGSKFTGKLDINGMHAGHLLMRRRAEFAEVDLCSAKIGGLVAMNGSKFTGKLNMNDMVAEGDLLMHGGAEFEKVVTLAFSKIGKNLILSGSTLQGLNLTGTHVGGVFALGSPPTRWSERANLKLLNTEVWALQVQDLPEAWPDKLELNGFTYATLSEFASEGANDLVTREVSWFKEWLEKQEKYSPQPYEQLAKILRNEGNPDKADELLYAGKNRELSEVEGLLSWLSLALLKVLIGYGYRIYYAIFWFLGFMTVGVLVLRISGQGSAHGMPYGIAYSLDMLLPIIRLRESHYDFDLAGWARYYFYLHTLMGYILASFLIAGLSGLTK